MFEPEVNLDHIKPINGKWYTAKFHAPSMTMRLTAKKSSFYYFLPLFSACDKPGERDIHGKITDVTVKKQGDTTVVRYRETCSVWDEKRYTWEFRPETVTFYYEVRGKGKVDRAYFFRGWMNYPCTVDEEMGAIPGFDTVFSPQPNFAEKNYYFTGDRANITVGNDETHWATAFVAAPFCYVLNDRGDKTWVWAGIGAKPGQYTFEEFNYNENVTKRIFGPGGFNCKYDGKLEVNGSWTTPHFVIGAARGPYDGIEKYIDHLVDGYGLKLHIKRKTPDWWIEPIFCGWGEQMSMGTWEYGNKGDLPLGKYCTQANHDKWLGILDKYDIPAKTIIIDADWSAKGDRLVNTELWPDLRGWIDKQHSRGIRTLLWFCAWRIWDATDDECITRDGKPITIDPSNPKYEKRLRRMMHWMLSPDKGCLNADGVKIDGSLQYPLGPNAVNYGNLWGLELQKRYIGIIYSAAKEAKEDSIVSTFFANPYMSDVCDMVRAADMYTIKGTPESSLIHRARIMKIGMPGCLLDTDWQFKYDKRDNWEEIMKTQLKLGIPCAYHIEKVHHFRPFTIPYFDNFNEARYKLMSKLWKDYRRRNGLK
jgi:hypothetical protein